MSDYSNYSKEKVLSKLRESFGKGTKLSLNKTKRILVQMSNNSVVDISDLSDKDFKIILLEIVNSLYILTRTEDVIKKSNDILANKKVIPLKPKEGALN